MHGAANPLNLEPVIDVSEPNRGFFDAIPVTLGDLRIGDGNPLTTGTNPTAAVSSDSAHVRWTGAQETALLVPSVLTNRFARKGYGDMAQGVEARLRMLVLAAYHGNGTAKTLRLDASLRVQPRQGALLDAIDPSVVLVDGVKEADPTAGGLLVMTANAGTKRLVVFEWALDDLETIAGLSFKLGPTTTPGTNNVLDLFAIEFEPRSHATLNRRADRVALT
ncbi:MAG: hypothetical protein KIS87_08835 [Phycisphaeraceae bacterium]|nr:hypothetical protein [Phycisphaeraceae bacterium]